MIKNVLVTGCAGFIGSNICEKLVDNLMAGFRKNMEDLEKKGKV